MKPVVTPTHALNAVEVQDQVTAYLFDEVSGLIRAGEATLKDGLWEMPLLYGLSGMTPRPAGVVRLDPPTSRIILPTPDLEEARDLVRRRAEAAIAEMVAENQALGLYD